MLWMLIPLGEKEWRLRRKHNPLIPKMLGRDTQIQVAITFVRIRNIFGGDIVLIRVPVRDVLETKFPFWISLIQFWIDLKRSSSCWKRRNLPKQTNCCINCTTLPQRKPLLTVYPPSPLMELTLGAKSAFEKEGKVTEENNNKQWLWIFTYRSISFELQLKFRFLPVEMKFHFIF